MDLLLPFSSLSRSFHANFPGPDVEPVNVGQVSRRWDLTDDTFAWIKDADANTFLSLNVRAGGQVAWANDEDVLSMLGGAV